MLWLPSARVSALQPSFETVEGVHRSNAFVCVASDCGFNFQSALLRFAERDASLEHALCVLQLYSRIRMSRNAAPSPDASSAVAAAAPAVQPQLKSAAGVVGTAPRMWDAYDTARAQLTARVIDSLLLRSLFSLSPYSEQSTRAAALSLWFLSARPSVEPRFVTLALTASDSSGNAVSSAVSSGTALSVGGAGRYPLSRLVAMHILARWDEAVSVAPARAIASSAAPAPAAAHTSSVSKRHGPVQNASDLSDDSKSEASAAPALSAAEFVQSQLRAFKDEAVRRRNAKSDLIARLATAGLAGAALSSNSSGTSINVDDVLLLAPTTVPNPPAADAKSAPSSTAASALPTSLLESCTQLQVNDVALYVVLHLLQRHCSVSPPPPSATAPATSAPSSAAAGAMTAAADSKRSSQEQDMTGMKCSFSPFHTCI
jgi:hypothetical protein